MWCGSIFLFKLALIYKIEAPFVERAIVLALHVTPTHNSFIIKLHVLIEPVILLCGG